MIMTKFPESEASLFGANTRYRAGGARYANTRRIIESIVNSQPDASRLDAVQGSGEARTELYEEVLLGSTGTDDAVMRQEFGAATELGSEADQNGGGAW